MRHSLIKWTHHTTGPPKNEPAARVASADGTGSLSDKSRSSCRLPLTLKQVRTFQLALIALSVAELTASQTRKGLPS
jgi:hypothetical protein